MSIRRVYGIADQIWDVLVAASYATYVSDCSSDSGDCLSVCLSFHCRSLKANEKDTDGYAGRCTYLDSLQA